MAQFFGVAWLNFLALRPARRAPTTKTTKNTPKHPRTSRPVVQRPCGCASACSRGCAPASCCCGGGGTGTSASGVGTRAVWWTGLPQFEQNCASSLNSCPQLLQYRSAMLVSSPTSSTSYVTNVMLVMAQSGGQGNGDGVAPPLRTRYTTDRQRISEEYHKEVVIIPEGSRSKFGTLMGVGPGQCELRTTSRRSSGAEFAICRTPYATTVSVRVPETLR